MAQFYNETVSSLPVQALLNDIIGWLQSQDDMRFVDVMLQASVVEIQHVVVDLL